MKWLRNLYYVLEASPKRLYRKCWEETNVGWSVNRNECLAGELKYGYDTWPEGATRIANW
jgi:hypothetical protein